MFTIEDRKQIEAKGISEEKLLVQIDAFRNGFPFLKLAGTASAGNGIEVLTSEEQAQYAKAWEAYRSSGRRIVKFVPASGAASRMFKDLYSYIESDHDAPATQAEAAFMEGIRHFAFYDALNDSCRGVLGQDIPALIASGRQKDVVRQLLMFPGLGYGNLPKGLLAFHRYPNGARTPIEEHLVEGALYGRMADDTVELHFTVSPEHRTQFESLVERSCRELGSQFGVTYWVAFSEQKSSTDTLAVDMDNHPFRDESGRLLFRPGGHGALIENLNEIDADVVFIKNIDNVVPDRLRPDTVAWKQIIGGLLISIQKQVFDYLHMLDSGLYTHDDVLKMLDFVMHRLHCRHPEVKNMEDSELAIYLYKKLNRPIRVCGMVRNVGEPGGGPFYAYNPDGTISLQILESSQIDMNDSQAKAMFDGGTHFNPVDLACCVRSYKGTRFDLRRYVDAATGFISYKSKNGHPLKALELPGLWNGAMSDWNTIFVEVPLSTFNPVKTVNDLLRPQHQQE